MKLFTTTNLIYITGGLWILGVLYFLLPMSSIFGSNSSSKSNNNLTPQPPAQLTNQKYDEPSPDVELSEFMYDSLNIDTSTIIEHHLLLSDIDHIYVQSAYDLLDRILDLADVSQSIKSLFMSKLEFALIDSTECPPPNLGCYWISYKSKTKQDENDDDNYKHQIIIAGTNGVELASGIKYFFSKYFGMKLSWNGNNLNQFSGKHHTKAITSRLNNAVAELLLLWKRKQKDKASDYGGGGGDSDSSDSNSNSKIIGNRLFEYSYYKNPCTDSYSMAFWDFERWSLEIDWMALNGINLLLLPTLNEYIEYILFTKYYKIKETQLADYFVGPAFLAWFRMGNLQGFPQRENSDDVDIALSRDWFKQQYDLTLQIINRCNQFGIELILPSFSGHVPNIFFNKMTNNGENTKFKFYQGSRWFGMPHDNTNLMFLDAIDPLFIELGNQYQSIQTQLLSIVLLPNRQSNGEFVEVEHDIHELHERHRQFRWLDQFNELAPAIKDQKYIEDVGFNQYASLLYDNNNINEMFVNSTSAYKNGLKWIVQGWMFTHMRSYWDDEMIQAYFKMIDSHDVLILDLFGERDPVYKV